MDERSIRLLFSGDPFRWHIEELYAQQAMAQFLANSTAAQGDTIAAFERMKAMNAPAIITLSGAMVGPGTLLSGRSVPQDSILRLNLTGPMMANGDWCSWGMDDFEQAIMAANQHPNISGIFIRANTGGGESLAGQILHNAIKSSKKAVVVYADMLASAGIHGTLAADEIISSGPASRMGSIGTYVSIDKELVEKYKQKVEEIYSTVSEDKNGEWRAYLAGDPKPLEVVVTQNAKMFQSEVRKFRPLRGDVEKTLRGGMFFSEEAKRLGLIDGIGTLYYAMSRMQANIQRRK